MRLVKRKRQYKLPKYRQIICVAIKTRTKAGGVFDWSLEAKLPSDFAKLNPDNISNPVFYCVGEGGQLYLWPTPRESGQLKVTLAVEKTV